MNNHLASLILRLGFGLPMLLQHGWGKAVKYSALSTSFPDPLGVGSELSLILAVGAELVCAGLLAVGLFTRLVSVPLIITMVVAFFMVHAGDPFGKKELSFIYLMGYCSIFFLGGGQYSLQKAFGLSSRNKLLNWLFQ